MTTKKILSCMALLLLTLLCMTLVTGCMDDERPGSESASKEEQGSFEKNPNEEEGDQGNDNVIPVYADDGTLLYEISVEPGLSEDGGEVAIVHISKIHETATVIDIPAEAKGLPVKHADISMDSIDWNDPEAVAAFEESASLTVKIPATVTEFYMENAQVRTERFEVDANNEAFSVLDGILYNKEMTKVLWTPGRLNGDVRIPASLSEPYAPFEIGIGIMGYAQIDTLTVESEQFDYAGCWAKKLVLGDNVAWSDRVDTTYRAIYAEEIEVSENHPTLSSYKGVLYNKDMTEIVCVPYNMTELEIAPTVIRLDDYAFYECKNLLSVTIPEDVEIGDYILCGCTGIEHLKMPNTVNIASLFRLDIYGSDWKREDSSVPKNLTTVEITSGDRIEKYMFAHAPITTVILPDTVKHIESYAFMGCKSLENIRLPEGLLSIGDSAFADCTSLADVTIPASVTQIGEYHPLSNTAFFNDPESWVDGVLYNGAWLLATNDSLPASLTVREGTKHIATWAFASAQNLVSIVLPDDLLTIQDNAFYGAWALTHIAGGDNATLVGKLGISLDRLEPVPYGNINYVFNVPISPVSRDIVTARFKEGTASIPERFFEGCTNLLHVYVPADCEIGDYAFLNTNLGLHILDGSTERGGGNWRCLMQTPSGDVNVGGYAIVDGVQVVAGAIVEGVCLDESGIAYTISGDKATVVGYFGETADGSLTVPTVFGENAAVTEIRTGAFKGLSTVKIVTLPESVTRIEKTAFFGCEALTAVTMRGVTAIEQEAFAGCSRLSTVELGNALTHIRSYAFKDCTSLSELRLPASLTAINPYAFAGCTTLVALTFDASNTSWYILTENGEAVCIADCSSAYIAAKYATDNYCDCVWMSVLNNQ